MNRILVVDDEKDIIYMIKDFMQIYDIEVVGATNGIEALEEFDSTIKLVILDINMDGLSGIEVCKKIRDMSHVPILFLTARVSQADKILGLGIGADDYIVKPFDPIELVARVQANIRRYNTYCFASERQEHDSITLENVVIYPKQHRVLKNNQELQLTNKEFELLMYMVRNPFIVLSREQILDQVWGNSIYDYNVVTTNIKRLRKKIEDNPEEPSLIKTVWGVGYVFEGKQKLSVGKGLR
ncbi:response regulator transcription factor [Geosporobacter ferrireducens]|uniref:Stage 0 sporulation protein A homolog n=1 Tax=Geosporobacter ferrireducens TaxID=1424294 RepID=A0A1D8GMC4_9FIRM|nr:response regulator transcription factor [Geosporobacter ferrireducens]AOT72044.1 hypothetical protein Gferi_22400 [Geosporobacter ferrireducens]MTI55926.1 response regulator transcription factor [Geosporobacter ferrireducens]